MPFSAIFSAYFCSNCGKRYLKEEPREDYYCKNKTCEGVRLIRKEKDEIQELLAQKGKALRKFEKKKSGYEGFYKTPMKWDTVVRKFSTLSKPFIRESHREKIIEAVENLDSIQLKELARLLGRFEDREL